MSRRGGLAQIGELVWTALAGATAIVAAALAQQDVILFASAAAVSGGLTFSYDRWRARRRKKGS